MGVWQGVKNMIARMLNIVPAQESQFITIREPYSYGASVLRNRLWYRGDPSELDQFYHQMSSAGDTTGKTRFWAATPSLGMTIRKMHSGLPALMVDRLADIVVADLDSINLDTDERTALWAEIANDNDFSDLLPDSIVKALVEGDGAFKLCFDKDVSDYPLIEFIAGDGVEYKRLRGRLQEIIFSSWYSVKEKSYRLIETYGPGYIRYQLVDEKGTPVPLTTVAELAEYQDIEYDGEFLLAVPLRIFKSSTWPGRGKSLFDGKGDNFDALDEAVSQWWDAIRAGRVKDYIPEDMVPRNPQTGELMQPNSFDNRFIKLQTVLAEDAKGQIQSIQAQIQYEAYLGSYASALDMCLQGIMSPATLGIDLKKTDNAEAQREKEKATLFTRGKIVDRLNEVIPQLVERALQVYDLLHGRSAGEYEVSVKFGEYASPSFDAVVETVGKARTFKVMSIERAIEEMYGDTWTNDEKKEEVARIKAEEAGMISDEEGINRDAPPGEDDA
ncbi:capsid protein [Paenibacillus sp. NFR01]|uniref:capsid protein n=1 Tax=Paenibacillus sp. NFR01 TaxID=1566279 RepID=UPI0008BC684F|nr:capsid protein [Paenibacillus sp. NFR01]SEU32391.1 hypothetical protein SAMN03159358_0118 [Paenibacillus sp. NFR01]